MIPSQNTTCVHSQASPYIISEVRSEAVTFVLLKIGVFWDVVLCHWASSYQHLWGPSKCQELYNQWYTVTSQKNWTSTECNSYWQGKIIWCRDCLCKDTSGIVYSIWGLPKKFCNTFYTCQNQQKMSAIFPVVNFDVLLATAGQQNNTVSCTHTQGIIKMAQYSDFIFSNGLLLNCLWQRKN